MCSDFGVGRLAALAFVALMVVAGWTVHRSSGFFIVSGGWEYNFVLAVVAVGVATIGPGEYSLDHLFGLIESFDAPPAWSSALAASSGDLSVASDNLPSSFDSIPYLPATGLCPQGDVRHLEVVALLLILMYSYPSYPR